jgi:hypothetical protein
MIGAATHPKLPTTSALTIVWVDAREAIVVRRAEGASTFERIESDVPAHHRSTGHVRHDPGTRHGGGGPPQTAGEPHRLEHLARFLDAVAARLPRGEDLLVIGPGTVREQLARQLVEDDSRHRVVRAIRCEAAASMTHRQLAALLRRASGDEPRRRTVGAYRWTASPPAGPSGRRPTEPRRVAIKRARQGDEMIEP